MKIARASKKDIDMAIELAGAIDSISHQWCPSMPEKIANSDAGEDFCADDPKQCVRVCEYLIALAATGSLFRVVIGMSAVLDPKNNITDPDADTLEVSPRIKAMESQNDALKAALKQIAEEPCIDRAKELARAALGAP